MDPFPSAYILRLQEQTQRSPQGFASSGLAKGRHTVKQYGITAHVRGTIWLRVYLKVPQHPNGVTP